MKQWFLGLAPRERLIVAAGGIVVVLVLLYVLVVEPLAQGYADRERRIAALEQDLAWMVEAAGEAEALRGTGRAEDRADDDRPAYLAVDSAIRGADLPRPDRLEPDGRDGARVAFGEVEFDRLVRVLGRLESGAGVAVTRARFDRLDDGLVEAELTLERRDR